MLPQQHHVYAKPSTKQEAISFTLQNPYQLNRSTLERPFAAIASAVDYVPSTGGPSEFAPW